MKCRPITQLSVVISVVTILTVSSSVIAGELSRDGSTPNRSIGGHRGPHGGTIKRVGEMQIETAISQGGIELYLLDNQSQPVSAEQSRGAVSLRVEGNAKRYRYDLLPDGKGRLTSLVNLSRVAGQQIELAIQLAGIPGSESRRITFTEVTTVPNEGATERPQVTVSRATEADKSLIAKQANCPVMDEPLGSMGGPIKVMVGDKPVFVCCKGCIKKVQAKPAEYVARVYGDRPQPILSPRDGQQVRPGVFKVTAVDAPFIAAQRECPVMEEPLQAMGGPYRVHAAGRAIYICCPGCAKKITADPTKYLAVLKQKGVDAPRLR